MTQRRTRTTRRVGTDARLARGVVVAVLVLLAVAWWNARTDPTGGGAGAPEERPSSSVAPGESPVGPRVDRATLLALLARAEVVPERPRRDGYDRDCGPGAGCVFGTPWSDDTEAPQGHDGCDTRNDVLAAQLRAVRFSERSPGCDVVAGELVDPYTGASVDHATHGSQIHVDHVYPLAAAWDHGAADWDPRLRAAFANDVDLELIPTTASANLGKGDSTPAEWLPLRREFRCAYLGRYLRIADAYGLSISADDAASVRTAAPACPPAD